MLDDGIEGTPPVIERAAPLNACMWLGRHVLLQHPHQARLPHARFATEQHHLPEARFGLLPVLLYEYHFFVPPHQRRQAGCGDGVETILDIALAQDAIDGYRRRHTSEGVCAEAFRGKVSLDEPESRRTDHHRIRDRTSLEPGGNIRCLAQR